MNSAGAYAHFGTRSAQGALVWSKAGGSVRILDVNSLPIPEVKVIRFGPFCDSRGYFSEPYRRSVVGDDVRTAFLREFQSHK